MTHSDLVKVEVQGADIYVAMRGTCFRVKYRKQEALWLVAQEYGPDDQTPESHFPNFEHLHGQRPVTRRARLGWLSQSQDPVATPKLRGSIVYLGFSSIPQL